MPMPATEPLAQATPYDTPWSFSARVRLLLWEWCWALFCRWTPKPLNRWRLAWLRLFGAQIEGLPFVHPRARIAMPWHLTLHDRACLGDRAHAYSLGRIELRAAATVAQEAYLCAATHELSDPSLPLRTAPIIVGEHAFVGARAFILPGIAIGERAVVGACAVVTRDVKPGVVVAGNPAREIGVRVAMP